MANNTNSHTEQTAQTAADLNGAQPNELNGKDAADAPEASIHSIETKWAEKLKEQEQKYVYLYAEFENFKKRAFKERQDIVKFGWENVASELLLVLDTFEMAIQHAKPDTDPNLMSGLKMLAQQFKSTLSKQGVAEIPTENQAFNPELHEAVGQVPSEKANGTIVQEHQKGYTLHGRLLRPSRVMVSSGVAAN